MYIFDKKSLPTYESPHTFSKNSFKHRIKFLLCLSFLYSELFSLFSLVFFIQKVFEGSSSASYCISLEIMQ